MATYMADMISQAQTAASTMPGAGAVPTTLVTTPEQERQQRLNEAEEASKRRTDLLLTLLSIVTALLAFEKIQRIASRPARWLWIRTTSLVRRENAASSNPPSTA